MADFAGTPWQNQADTEALGLRYAFFYGDGSTVVLKGEVAVALPSVITLRHKITVGSAAFQAVFASLVLNVPNGDADYGWTEAPFNPDGILDPGIYPFTITFPLTQVGRTAYLDALSVVPAISAAEHFRGRPWFEQDHNCIIKTGKWDLQPLFPVESALGTAIDNGFPSDVNTYTGAGLGTSNDGYLVIPVSTPISTPLRFHFMTSGSGSPVDVYVDGVQSGSFSQAGSMARSTWDVTIPPGNHVVKLIASTTPTP
jgi:hypothetical protein